MHGLFTVNQKYSALFYDFNVKGSGWELFWYSEFLYPTQRVAEGIMFLTRPSVSQSISSVFLVSTTPLKPLNRISGKFVGMKDIMCWCAYPQEILIQFFFSELPLFELRNLAKMKDTTETFCQHNSSETAQQNFMKLCIFEGHTM